MDPDQQYSNTTESLAQGAGLGLPEQAPESQLEGTLVGLQNQRAQTGFARPVRGDWQRPQVGLGGNMPGMFLPFSEADRQDMRSLTNGLSQAQQQVRDGMISREHGAELTSRIMGQLAPLVAKQQQTQQRQKAAMRNMAFEQASVDGAIQKTRMQATMNDFGSTIYSHTDPNTGQEAHFYPEKHGDVTVKQMDTRKEMPKGGEEGMAPPQPEYDPKNLGFKDNAPPFQQTGPNQHVMTIQNGAHIQKFQFDRDPQGQWSSQLVADNRPVDTANGQGLSGPRMEALMERADQDYEARAGGMPGFNPRFPRQSQMARQQWMQGKMQNRRIYAQDDLANTKIQAATQHQQAGQEFSMERIKAHGEEKKAQQERAASLRSEGVSTYKQLWDEARKDAKEALPEGEKLTHDKIQPFYEAHIKRHAKFQGDRGIPTEAPAPSSGVALHPVVNDAVSNFVRNASQSVPKPPAPAGDLERVSKFD